MAQLPVKARGRASRSNETSRYEAFTRAEFDDGWTAEDGGPSQQATTLTAEAARVIISRNDSPDIGFDRSINPYRGCEHGCIYCYARPTHAYLGLSPGLDFETKLYFKPDARRTAGEGACQAQLPAARIQLGGNTDPYQPIERKLKITRAILGVLARYRHPVGITTKSALVTRDLDILAPMAAENLAAVSISVTSLDRKLARAMEPRASTPERRIAAIRELAAAGVPAMIGFAPIIPGLNDHEMEAVLAKGGRSRCGLRPFHGPAPAARDQGPVPRMAGGRAARPRPARDVARAPDAQRPRLRPEWGKRMHGEGPIADMIATRFRLAARKFGLDQRPPPLDVTRFVRPSGDPNQMELFG